MVVHGLESVVADHRIHEGDFGVAVPPKLTTRNPPHSCVGMSIFLSVRQFLVATVAAAVTVWGATPQVERAVVPPGPVVVVVSSPPRRRGGSVA